MIDREIRNDRTGIGREAERREEWRVGRDTVRAQFMIIFNPVTAKGEYRADLVVVSRCLDARLAAV